MRCFVAVELPGRIVANLEPVLVKLQKIGLQTTPSSQIHSTLCFLDEVPDGKVGQIVGKLRSVSFPPFTCACVGIGAFPSPSKPNVVWAGLHSQQLVDLAELIGTTLGIKEERPFHGHATLARVKRHYPGLKELISSFSEVNFGIFEVNSFSLKASKLAPTGAVYTTIEEFHLV